jgi:hypothetical protein
MPASAARTCVVDDVGDNKVDDEDAGDGCDSDDEEVDDDEDDARDDRGGLGGVELVASFMVELCIES